MRVVGIGNKRNQIRSWCEIYIVVVIIGVKRSADLHSRGQLGSSYPPYIDTDHTQSSSHRANHYLGNTHIFPESEPDPRACNKLKCPILNYYKSYQINDQGSPPVRFPLLIIDLLWRLYAKKL